MSISVLTISKLLIHNFASKLYFESLITLTIRKSVTPCHLPTAPFDHSAAVVPTFACYGLFRNELWITI